MANTERVHDTQHYIDQGNDALRTGSMYEARKYFRQATELDPDNIDAWLGMASSVPQLREQQTFLERVLLLQPDHAEARQRLADVEEWLESGLLLAPKHARKSTTATPADEEPTEAETIATYLCYRHPDRETVLMCTQCGKPICHDCVRPAFVGQLCPECAQERRPVNYQVSMTTLAVAGMLAFIHAMVIMLLFNALLIGVGFFSFILAFILAPMAGEFLIRILDRVTHAKRGKEMQTVVGCCMGAAAGILLLPTIYDGELYVVLPALIFIVIAISTAATRLR